MHEKGGLYLDFDNDPEGIISRTVSIMVVSLDTTSDVLPDPLLKDLFDKTNPRDANLDQTLMCELFDALYTTYRFLKGLPEKELEEGEFNQIFLAWHILLWVETLRRARLVTVTPFPIFDFDNLPDLQMDLKLDKSVLLPLLN
ncbi:hypothetical protein PY092_17815 [Muricauda sp. 334s03]|jgi:hypothetical protein|uniref:Uncharacterized protein n=2 Tax=Flagellimonas TaxID=444459 RepID=A0ABT5XTC6_9FLAO|nr:MULTISPECIES: hypothetical protein [Allomuricauda]MDF0709146.1 hypothetical protein [[Muricauda] okinawensis]MDF0718025.1 hypothetical protein [[Muricauda] yonaguniensis]